MGDFHIRSISFDIEPMFSYPDSGQVLWHKCGCMQLQGHLQDSCQPAPLPTDSVASFSFLICSHDYSHPHSRHHLLWAGPLTPLGSRITTSEKRAFTNMYSLLRDGCLLLRGGKNYRQMGKQPGSLCSLVFRLPLRASFHLTLEFCLHTTS